MLCLVVLVLLVAMMKSHIEIKYFWNENKNEYWQIYDLIN